VRRIIVYRRSNELEIVNDGESSEARRRKRKSAAFEDQALAQGPSSIYRSANKINYQALDLFVTFSSNAKK